MAQVIYTKITELTPIEGTGLRQDDVFMISRPGADNNYVSYKCEYEDLSSAFVTSVTDALKASAIDIDKLQVVTDKEDLSPTRRRLVSENVIYDIAQSASDGAGQNGALLKKNARTQLVEGPVKFTGKLQCGNSEIAEDADVVNYAALENYVSTAGIMPFFKGCAAETDGCKTIIRPDPKNDLNGILHKISEDCMAQVILYSTQKYDDFCIFAYCMTCHGGEFDAIYSGAKAEIENGNLPADNYCILQHQPLAAKKPVVVNLPMRKENILCFFPKGTYDTESGQFKPVAGTKIKKNTLTITVKEYRAFKEG